ncbi:ABC transporter substrate-binding protein [Pusillimonas sp. CC-YST705]|uniref:ABC transporter substrate-binding protein n=1 Tax=Mesopusillimonas faecipullorum TaxID=2755040 RepID=A0ABS8CDP4_9BURK|nr:ABC transporter substrate-binding protein [Mesopusillimonas faecipullorum]MCB5364145.1 ABC transporter substrate-binding protein [Mesopusillimonas faecipullorum]
MKISTKLISMLTLSLSLGATAAVAQTKITVAYTAVSEFMPVFVAKERGFFSKRGLDVTPQQLALSGVMPAALQSGSVQIAGAASPVLLQANDSGLEMVGIAGTSVHSKDSKAIGLVVRNDGKITQASDLIGKKIAVPGLNAALHIIGRKWLSDQGVDPRQVSFVEGAFPQMGDMLKGGSIDAAVTADPFLGRIVDSGSGTLLSQLAPDLPAGFSNMLYMTTRSWQEKNSKAIEDFRAALSEALEFAAANPEEAQADMGKYLKIPAPVLAKLAKPSYKVALNSDELQFWADTMREQNMLERAPDLKALVAE